MNKAGKSTLAKIIAGLYNPSAGIVIYNKKQRPDNVMINCAMVFQNFCKYYLTVRENIAFGEVSYDLHSKQRNFSIIFLIFL